MEYILYNVAVGDSDIYTGGKERSSDHSADSASISSRLDLA